MDNPYKKYKPFKSISLDDRKWPSNTIKEAPLWCSVDLRDGNQALIEPMGSERKNRMFELLCSYNFKRRIYHCLLGRHPKGGYDL